MVPRTDTPVRRIVTVSFVLLLVTASTTAPVAAERTDTHSTRVEFGDVTTPAQSTLEDIQRTLERIDDFLETVVDLMRTLSRLTGEGGEVGGG